MFDTPPFFDARDFAWSPDSRYIAYLSAGAKTFQNVSVVPVGGGSARPVSFLANTNAGSLSWSPDGAYLTFATAQRTEPGDVIRVDLLPRTPKFREDQFRDLFKDEQPKTPSDPSSPPATPAAPTAPAVPAVPAHPPDDSCGQAGRSRLRRHQAACERVAGGRRCRTAGDQPRRQMAAADGERRGPAEPVRIFDRRAVEGTGGGAAADVDAGCEAQSRTSRRTAKRCTTSIAVACSTSRSSVVSRRRLP